MNKFWAIFGRCGFTACISLHAFTNRLTKNKDSSLGVKVGLGKLSE